MSLESCPTCGYALSTEGGQCRHCRASFTVAAGPRSVKLDMRFMFQMAMAIIAGIMAYRIFFVH